MVKPGGPMSLSRQCALLGVSRSSHYYRPKGEGEEDLALMRRMGMEAAYRRPRTSRRGPESRVVPYLLRDLTISRAD